MRQRREARRRDTLRSFPSRRSSQAQPAEGRPGPSNDDDDAGDDDDDDDGDDDDGDDYYDNDNGEKRF